MKENKITVSQEIKKHLLTGISWMIPLIVAAGICIALGQVLGGTDVGEKTGNDSNLLIVFYVQIMPDDLVMQLHRF